MNEVQQENASRHDLIELEARGELVCLPDAMRLAAGSERPLYFTRALWLGIGRDQAIARFILHAGHGGTEDFADTAGIARDGGVGMIHCRMLDWELFVRTHLVRDANGLRGVVYDATEAVRFPEGAQEVVLEGLTPEVMLLVRTQGHRLCEEDAFLAHARAVIEELETVSDGTLREFKRLVESNKR
jgi:hypothetical protein